MPRQPEADPLAARLAAVAARAHAACDDLTPEELARVPAPGAWSIATVLEHLVLGDGLYLAPMRAKATDARARGRFADGAAWRPSLLGGLLERAVRPGAPRKLRAPRALEPGPRPRPSVLAAFLVQLGEIAALVAASADLDWTRVRLSSPVNRLVRMNLGDAFHVLASHAERHLDQIERARAVVRGAAEPTTAGR